MNLRLIDCPLSERLPPDAMRVWEMCLENLREMNELYAMAARRAKHESVIRHIDRHHQDAVSRVIEQMVDVLAHHKVEFMFVNSGEKR